MAVTNSSLVMILLNMLKVPFEAHTHTHTHTHTQQQQQQQQCSQYTHECSPQGGGVPFQGTKGDTPKLAICFEKNEKKYK
jgi:hypothetical protein